MVRPRPEEVNLDWIRATRKMICLIECRGGKIGSLRMNPLDSPKFPYMEFMGIPVQFDLSLKEGEIIAVEANRWLDQNPKK